MSEEKSKNYSGQGAIKTALGATLRMAKKWARSEHTFHHAIKSFQDVIQIDPDSPEANEARQGLLTIAEGWEKRGQDYAAIRLYKELMTDK